MIYIVRHGETEWNVLGKIQGRKDIELNENGIKQALSLKEKFKDIKFDKVFSSPLKRAIQTAKIITGNNIIIDKRLIERNKGLLEGKIKKEIKVLPNFNDLNDTSYGVESLESIKNRLDSFYNEILKKYPKQNILIVTHAGVGIYTKCFFVGEPKDNNYLSYKLKNGEVWVFEN